MTWTYAATSRLLVSLAVVALLAGCGTDATSSPSPTTVATADPAEVVVTPAPPAPKVPAVVPPEGPAFACPPGTNPDTPGPIDQARPPRGWSSMAFDRESGRIVLVGEGDDGGVETWTFDVCTNTWTRMHPSQEPGLGLLVYDVDSDVTIGYDLRRVWAYDLEADTWTRKGPLSPLAGGGYLGFFRFYDPVSGRVVAVADDRGSTILGPEMWSYEVETSTWTPIPQANRPAIGHHDEDLAYDAFLDRLVVYTGAEDGMQALRGQDVALRPSQRNLVGDGRRHPGVHLRGVGEHPCHRLRRGGGADRDAGPGSFGRVRRDRGPLGDPERLDVL